MSKNIESITKRYEGYDIITTLDEVKAGMEGFMVMSYDVYNNIKNEKSKKFIVMPNNNLTGPFLSEVLEAGIALYEIFHSHRKYPLFIDYDFDISPDDHRTINFDTVKCEVNDAITNFISDYGIENDYVIAGCMRKNKISFHIHIFGIVAHVNHQKILVKTCIEKYFKNKKSLLGKIDYQPYNNRMSLRMIESYKEGVKLDYLFQGDRGRKSILTSYLNSVHNPYPAYPINNLFIVDEECDEDGNVEHISFEYDKESIYEGAVTKKEEYIPDEEVRKTLTVGGRKKYDVELTPNLIYSVINKLPNNLVNESSKWRWYSKGVKYFIKVFPEIENKIFDKWVDYCKNKNTGYKSDTFESCFYKDDGFNECKADAKAAKSLITAANSNKDFYGKQIVNLDDIEEEDDDFIDVAKSVISTSHIDKKSVSIGWFSEYRYETIFLNLYSELLRQNSKNMLVYTPSNHLWIELHDFNGQLKSIMFDVISYWAKNKIKVMGNESSEELKNEYKSFLKSRISPDYCTKVKSYYAANPNKLKVIEENSDVIPFINGICYDAKNDSIRSIEKDDFVTNTLALEWEDDFDCDSSGGRLDSILKPMFMDEIRLYDDLDKESERFMLNDEYYTINDYNYLIFKLYLGYAFTGHYNKKLMMILKGPANNGKTFITKLLEKIGGKLCSTVNKDRVLTNPTESETNPDLVKMLSKRFVTCSELEKGDKWNESLVKQITGRDTISVRTIFDENERLPCKAKMILVTNFLPPIPNNEAFKNRLLLINMPKQYVNKCKYDQNLKLGDKKIKNIEIATDEIIDTISDREMAEFVVHCVKLFYKSGKRIDFISNVVEEEAPENTIEDLVKAKIEFTGKSVDTINLKQLCSIIYPDAPFTKTLGLEIKNIMQQVYNINFDAKKGFKGVRKCEEKAQQVN